MISFERKLPILIFSYHVTDLLTFSKFAFLLFLHDWGRGIICLRIKKLCFRNLHIVKVLYQLYNFRIVCLCYLKRVKLIFWRIFLLLILNQLCLRLVLSDVPILRYIKKKTSTGWKESRFFSWCTNFLKFWSVPCYLLICVENNVRHDIITKNNQ